MSDNIDLNDIFQNFTEQVNTTGSASFSVTGNLQELLNEMEVDLDNMPIVPLRDTVLFPMISTPLPIGRPTTIELLKKCEKENIAFCTFTQKDPQVEQINSIKELYTTGVLCKVVKVITLPNNQELALVQSFGRMSLKSIRYSRNMLTGSVTERPESPMAKKDRKLWEGLLGNIYENFNSMLSIVGEEDTAEVRFTMNQLTSTPRRLVSFIAEKLPVDTEEKMRLLEIDNPIKRLTEIASDTDGALQRMQLQQEIRRKTHQSITQQQKEAFLQQQIRAMQDELGGNPEDSDFDELESRAKDKKWNDSVAKHFDKELRKLERYNPTSPDYAIQYTYLDQLLNLPWESYSEGEISLSKVTKRLNKDHSGLEKVKERIIEQMAVLKLRGDMKAPILCLYGPPGVGKTSLGKSIADAIGRDYARISLGGVHDEAEIRGHRRTYIGAMPGRIISAIAKCGTSNPVIVLDEIDKIGADHKGDPSTALLEVLDPEQNSKFHDNYIDVDYDLSNVLFIATANSLDTISRPLRDRMEIIEISGYIKEEKIEIAQKHLIPKVLLNIGFNVGEITFTKAAVDFIVEHYTREAGVRQLEKKISAVLRKLATLKASGKPYPVKVTPDLVRQHLGPEEITADTYENNDTVGVVTGLAWTAVGGDILFIESSLSHGKGDKLTLTGNLGDVMKESATLALQYLKANCHMYGIENDAFEKYNVHIHVPEGAVPKDGPSAGVTMVTSLASSFTGRKVREKLAMTGEITLRGKVLPVGGIKEKILAAKRAGITDIILCKANKKDIDKIAQKYLSGLTFHYVDTISDVLEFALI